MLKGILSSAVSKIQITEKNKKTAKIKNNKPKRRSQILYSNTIARVKRNNGSNKTII